MASPAPQLPDSGSRPLVAPGVERVWMDVTGTILGHEGRFSPIGADVMRRAMRQFNRAVLRVERPVDDPRNLAAVFDGRAWLNLSALRGYLSESSLGRWVGEVDPSLAGCLDTCNVRPTDDLWQPHLIPGLMFQGARAMAAAVAGQVQPARAAGQAEVSWSRWLESVERRAAHPVDSRGIESWVDHLLAPTAHLVVHELMPLIALATTAARSVRDPFAHRSDCQPLLHALLGGLDGHRASRFVLDAVGEMSDERFLERYGHLGERVMDVAAPRFDEQPDQLYALRRALPAASRIEADRARAAQARKLAVSTLASELTGPIDRARFLAATEVVQSLGGLSDWALEAFSICLAHCRRALLAVVEAADVPEGLQWSDMRLEQIEALRMGRSIPEAVDGPLPGRPLQSGSSRPDSGLVGGIATGTLTHPDTDTLPERPIWLLDSVGLAAIPPIASGVGAVVTSPVARGGPAVLVAAMLGRPCVSVSSAASLVPGVRVTVDGERGTVVSAS